MTSLYLSPVTWDLCVDAQDNIAMATSPYAIAQDVANVLRTFLGECWYDTTQGVPYLQQILGQSVPLSLIKSQIQTAALTVPGVAAAQVFISSIVKRKVTGQVQLTMADGSTTVVAL